MANLLQMPLLFGLESPPEEARSAHPDPPQQSSGAVVFAPEEASLEGAPEVADAGQRNEALDIHRSWVVEAPAGSGKTGLLIQRFLKLLADTDVERPDQVLAITFTRKADAEMRRRVLEQIAAAHTRAALPLAASPFERSTRQIADRVLQRDQLFGWNLLENPHQLNIRTIDSLCAELAGSTPLHTGPGGRYSPTDDPEPLYRLAAERVLLRLGNAEGQLTSDLELLLLHRDALPGDVQTLLGEMLRNRMEWGELIPLDAEALTEEALNGEVLPRLVRTLQRLLRQELEAAATHVGPVLADRLARLGYELSGCADLSPDSPLAGLPGTLGTSAENVPHWNALTALILTSEGTWRQRLTRKKIGASPSTLHKAELTDLIDAFQSREADQPGLADRLCALRKLPEADFPDEQWRVVKALCRVLREALLELQIVFGERQSCDFTEVALAAKALLQAGGPEPDALQTFTGNLRHLLVDEMQDTSAGQYELLETLTQSWDGATQTVFLVGDPKQSIYEFRQARVERFRRVMTGGQFGQIGVSALRLTANFRSQAVLVHAVNDTFGQIFPLPDDPRLTADSPDVAFVAATPTRAQGVTPAQHWQFTFGASRGSKTARSGAEEPVSEAQRIRETIEAFQQRWMHGAQNKRPPRIAVLGRARSHLAAVIQQFYLNQGSGPLPFRAVDIEALNERPEILDLMALTRALLDPGDRVAWLALLRSPVCGLALADLLTLTGDMPGDEDKQPLPEQLDARAHLLTPQGQDRLRQVWPILRQALATSGTTTFSTHLERTWRSLGGDAALANHEKGNALRFLDLLHNLEAGPDPLTLGLLQRKLRSLYAEPSAPDAVVELMTIHKSKGLEWDLVLVPGLHRGSGQGDQEFLKWLEFVNPDGTPEFLLTPIQSKGDAAYKLSSWMNRRQHEREQAEGKRLLYVACTRAREELHLFAAVTTKEHGALALPKQDSLLAAAWPVAGAVASEQQRRRQDRGVVIGFPSLPPEVEAEQTGLALAAAGEEATCQEAPATLRRLPASFQPLARLAAPGGAGLSYPAPETLPHAAAFARPEGSFAARAFGNSLHRFLVLTAERLEGGASSDALLAELPLWHRRFTAVLRTEGLLPGDAPREAERALEALAKTLADPNGGWLLGPRPQAQNEAPVPVQEGRPATSLRADRTFMAGAVPQTDETSHLWIVDYKTADPGGRVPDLFLQSQQEKYAPQMEAYAKAAVAGGFDPARIVLALYFPLLATLRYWAPQDLFLGRKGH